MASQKIDHYSMRNKLKIVFLGDIEVGKTAVINSFMHGKFDQTHQPTIGIDFLSKTMVIEDRVVRFQLWDTAGQEKFHALIPTYIKDASAAVLVFDVTNRASFLNIEKWFQEVQEKRRQEIIIVLVANKIDLAEERQVTEEEGDARARQLGALYLEVSAKLGHNIKQIFKVIASELPEEPIQNDSIVLSPENNTVKPTTSTSKCC